MSEITFTYNREERKVSMERVFDAPPERIWKAMTDPELIPKWWGPDKYATIVDEMDVRVGGSWRFINKDAEGNEFAFNGVYLEIDPPRRIVQTFNFEPLGPGHENTETAVLEPIEGGKTRMIMTSIAKSTADYDGYVASGMESGARETWERLAGIVESIANPI